jgi:hypothetical protein
MPVHMPLTDTSAFHLHLACPALSLLHLYFPLLLTIIMMSFPEQTGLALVVPKFKLLKMQITQLINHLSTTHCLAQTTLYMARTTHDLLLVRLGSGLDRHLEEDLTVNRSLLYI